MDSADKTWDGIIDAISDHTVIRVGNGTVSDLLPAFYTGTLSIIKYHYNRCYMDFVTTIGERYIAAYCRDRGGFLGWKQIVTAERPEEFNVSINEQENWTDVWPEISPSRYAKTQEGLVILYLCIKQKDKEWFPSGTWTLGRLPVGFRPSKYIGGTVSYFDEVNFDNGSTFGSNGGIRVHVLTNGDIRLNHRGLAQIKQIEGTITFLAN